jgi:phosphoglycolate phosphatase
MINLLIFDLDGTLFDTAPGIAGAFNRLLDKYDQPHVSVETVIKYIGNGIKDLLLKLDSNLASKLGDTQAMEVEFHELYKQCFLEGAELYPGVLDFLKKWPHSVAIISNKDEYYVRELVARTELRHFAWTHIIGGNTYPTKKPHPDPLLRVLTDLNLQPENVVMIGDGLPDMGVAINTGVKSVAIDFGYSEISELIRDGAHATISHYNELEKVLHSFK